MDGGDWRLPQCRRHLYRLHHAGFPRQIYAFHGRAAGCESLQQQHHSLRQGDSSLALNHSKHREQRTKVAPFAVGADYWLSPEILLETGTKKEITGTAPRGKGAISYEYDCCADHRC